MGFLTDLTETTDPVSGDFLLIADASASASDRDRRVDVGKFCLLAGTGAFTAQRTFSPTATGVVAITINMPSSTTSYGMEILYNSTLYQRFFAQAASNLIVMNSVNLGNNVAGPGILLARNTNAGAEGPVAGHFRWVNNAGTSRYSWTDNSNLVRIHSAAPTGSSGSPTVSDTAGSVLGDQTSWYAAKNVGERVTDAAAALKRITALAIHEFTYKESSYQDKDGKPQTFVGLVGRKRDDWFLKNCGPQQLPALNEISVIGNLVLSVQALAARVEALET